MKRALIGTGLLLLLAGCAAPSAPPAAQGERTITQGERLVGVFSSVQNATTNEICRTVDGVGNIDLPYLDNLRVLGLTLNEASTLIVNSYVPSERELSVKVTRAP